MRPYLYGLLGVTLAFASYIQIFQPNWFLENLNPTPSQFTKIQASPLDDKIPNIMEVSPQQMRNTLEDSYRLQPDRRFLLAIANIYTFFTGEKPSDPQVNFDGILWHIHYQGINVGSIPEFPDFSNFMTLLVNWTKHLNRKHPIALTNDNFHPNHNLIKKEFNNYYTPSMALVAQMSNQFWNQGIHHNWVIQSAATALAQIIFQTLDLIEITDALKAKSLCNLALARGLTASAMSREETLIAEALGYSSHANLLALTLPLNDPLRLFLLKEDSILRNAAHSQKTNKETRYLWLLRLAKKGNFEEWQDWLASAFGEDIIQLSVIKTGFNLNSFYSKQNFPKLTQLLILLNLSKESGNLSTQTLSKIFTKGRYNKQLSHSLGKILGDSTNLKSLLNKFEIEVSLPTERYSGVFFNSQDYELFFRSYFYSSIFTEGLFYLDNLSDRKSANTYAEILKASSNNLLIEGQKTVNKFKRIVFSKDQFFNKVKNSMGSFSFFQPNQAQQLSNWYYDLTQAQNSQPKKDEMIEQLMGFNQWGTPLILRTWQELQKHLHSGDPGIWICVRRLVSQLDTRPEHLKAMADIAYENLLDLKLYEKVTKQLINVAEQDHIASKAYISYLNRDQIDLLQLLRDPTTPTNLKSYIVSLLNKFEEVPLPVIENWFKKVVKEDPKNWKARKPYISFLLNKKKYDSARIVIQDWLNKKVLTSNLEIPHALTKLAKTYYEEKQYNRALPVILEAVPSYTGGSLSWAGKIFKELGQQEQAEEMFIRCYKRYPGSASYLSNLVGFYWNQSKFTKVALLIKNHPYTLTANHWHQLGFEITKNFKEKPLEQSLQALDAITQISSYSKNKILKIWAQSAFESGHSELAFRLSQGVYLQGSDSIIFRIKMYTYLKEFAGEEKAVNWLRENLPQQLMGPAAMYFFADSHFELLWKVMKSPDTYNWVLRAASSLIYFDISPKEIKQLKAYYSLPGMKENKYGILGLYLLNEISKKELLLRMDTPKKRCEYSFFLGFKAQTQGRIEEAIDWYRICLETGLSNNGEYFFAMKALKSLISSQKSLSHFRLQTRSQAA